MNLGCERIDFDTVDLTALKEQKCLRVETRSS